MSKIPSVKGASFQNTHQMVKDLLTGSVLDRQAVEVRFSKGAVEMLDAKIEPSLWYEVGIVDEFSRLVVDIRGDGHPEFMQEIGRQALPGIIERESYKQFIDGAMKQRGREGQTLVGLASLLYNFGEWTYVGEDLVEFQVVVDDVGPLPELAGYSAAGFVEALVQYCTGDRIQATPRREGPDRLILDVTRGDD